MNQFEVINMLKQDVEELDEIGPLLEFALKSENVSNAVFNVILVDNALIHKINKEYRGIDRPTDVISFALEDDNIVNCPGVRILGDIYISYDKAVEQANEYGHSLLREMSFLSVHGLLHLLGYDHMEKEDEKIMFSRQELILDEYGITR